MGEANYIVETYIGNSRETFYAENFLDLEYFLKIATFAWCEDPRAHWADNEKSDWQQLYTESLDKRDFGDIASVYQYDEERNVYVEW